MKAKALTLLTAGVMLTASTPMLPVYAAEKPVSAKSMEELPEWVPTDFESALEFRNTYGATHVEDGLICAVFWEQAEKIPEGEPQGVLRYNIIETKDMTKCLKHDIYGSKDNAFNYEVIVYKPLKQGEFEISFADTWVNLNGEKNYTFSINDSLNAVETDIYSWLPDCFKEYRNYELTNRKIFVKDNYVVFCLDSNAGTAFEWFPTPSNEYDRSVIDYVMTEYCTEETSELLDGGEQYRVEVYQAKKDGMAKISYDYIANYGRPYLPEEVDKTLVANCAIIDNAQNILLPGNMRVTLVDYDTGEPLTISENTLLSIWTDIRYYTPEGDMITGPIYSIDNNPGIIDQLWNYSKADQFSFRLGDYDIPEGYAAPDFTGFVVYSKGCILPDFMTVTEYENGSADVVFKLKKETKRVIPEEKSADLTDLKNGETRITFYDKDTGELIPSELVEHHNLGFGTDIRFRSNMSPNGWMYTGPIYAVEANPQVYKTDLANLYRSADYFEFLCDDQPEVTLYDNGAMDLVIRTKIKVSGNINGDSEFSIADVVALQKWLLNAYDKDIYNWAEADFDLDNKITIFDLVLMRKALLKLINLPVEVSVKEETDGVVGAVYLYKVYRVGDTYYLSYQDMTTDQYPQPLAVKITESEYREIMAQDYESMIRNMNVQNEPEFGEGSYTLELSYSDDSKKKAASARMPDVLEKLRVLKEKYFNFVEPDNRLLYGSMFTVVKDGLKLYLGPDESYRSVDNIPKGTQLYEIGYQKDNDIWLFTKYNGQYGWLRMVEDDNSTITIYYADVVAKPVIYLYPEEKTDVHVELELTEADLSTTYPRYNNGWDVTASPDGSLLNKSDGTHHKYLFWDASNCRTRFDFSKGFCVAGSDTESFLKEKLTYMGLTEEEMNEFIIYWLPLMEHNRYNLIVFQDDAYTNSAKLNITPTPDSILRVFMTYVPLKEAVDIQPQQLETFERKGFTVVEWGGSEIKA
ncbi:hypothetical protein [Ruminococcus sp.]|uniref:hypothetical protein n=1 Tax=Ruminococcus sp. TaxID=41978 RepID=UPI0025FB1CC4|nr:hypothetical protein [Ruminococcus sp.]